MGVNSNQFESFESSYSLFELHADNVPIWERIRYQVFRKIKRQNEVGKAHSDTDQTTRNYIKRAWLYLKNFIHRNPYCSREHEYLFIGHPRRKKRQDGNWWDIYFDPIHERSDYDYIHLEPHYLLEHRQPSRTENIRYQDIINLSHDLQLLLNLNEVTIPQSIRQKLDKAKKTIDELFNAEIDLKNIVRRNLHTRRARLWMYDKLLDRIDPEIVVLVVSYGKETFIEACKNKGIPVVELQHGVIHPSHLGYSFSGNRNKTMFPDYLLTWGEFWSNDIEFPIPDGRIIPVGYPYLEQTRNQYRDTQSQKQILFISQGTIGATLSKFAVEVDQHSSIEHDVIYKLHPGEYDRWQDEYSWLADADIKVIDSSEPQLYQLFAKSSVQVGVGSTAIYEGLVFDLETYIYDCQESSVLSQLIEHGPAKLIQSSEELAKLIGYNDVLFDKNDYFAPNALRQAISTLNHLVKEGTQYDGMGH